MPAELVCGARLLAAETCDLSAAGAFVRSQELLPAGTECELFLPVVEGSGRVI